MTNLPSTIRSLRFEEPLLELDDEALALEYDEEADVLPAESAPVAYEQPAYGAEAASVDPAQEEIDLDFDLAMAEVDMDFGTDDNEPAPVFDAPVDVPERSFQTENLRGYEPASVAPVAASYVPAQAAAAPYAAAPSYASPSYASPSYAAPVSSASSYAAEPEELSLEDELNALLGNRVAPAVLTAEYDHTPIQPASASEHADWGSYDDEALPPVAEDDRFSAPAEAQPADDLEFDDGAFAAAFENSLVSAAPAAEEQDPFAYLQDMGSKAAPAADTVGLYRNQSTPSSASYAATPLPSAPASAYRETRSTRQRFADDMPEVETVDIPEAAVAFADDLDIPELAYEDDAPAAAPYDDFDSDFAGAFGETVQQEEPVRMPAAPVHASSQGGYAPGHPEPRYDAAAYAAPQSAAPQYDFGDTDDRYAPAAAGGVRGGEDFRDFDYDEELDEEIAIPAYQETRRAMPRNGMLIAAVVGGVALLGGIGAFALSFGDSSTSDVPAVVKADDGPIKVRPENPGGTVVPNQENKVFETMAGKTGGAAPAQERLITTAEEPVDMAARSAEPVAPAAGEASAKADDRIDPAAAGSENADSMEVAAVAPRKVKTMVVRADGTLVPREEPAPVSAEAVGEPAGVDAKPLAPATDEPALAPGDETGSTFTLPGTEPVAVAPETTATAAAPEMPAAMPVAPSRPADQPVDVVGEVKADKVAAVASAAPTGAYAMQIASQPTEAGAQETYQDLARRYASVIGGRDASIVKAEIPGKGTFWRVRIAASSRNEAVSLCESYKSAGGNCFVSK